MGYYEEDFYNEPSEFDEQIDEFKKSLMVVVKKEFLDEMERLRLENNNLQIIKDSWEDLKSSYGQKAHELEIVKSNALAEARKLTLEKLMGDYQLILYKVGYEYHQRPKCANCDKTRQLHFTTPAGKDVTVSCDCNTSDTKYVPNSHIVYEFRKDNWDHKLRVWYKQLTFRNDNDCYFELDGSGNIPEKMYDGGMKFEDINSYNTYFKNVEDCQKYCDWLNKNNK
jgi:hypothetical protein